MDHPTSTSTSRPARRWRRLGGGLLGLALVAATGVGGSSLAGAVEPADAGVPRWEGAEGAVPVETTETESRAQRAARETDAALLLAGQLLNDPDSDCNRLISGSSPAGGRSASEVLAGLVQERAAGNRLRFDDLYDYDRRDSEGNRILAYADGEGTGGHMTLYQGFHSRPYDEHYFEPLSSQSVQAVFSRYGGAPTAAQARAMIVLHELAHLTGRLGQHTDESALSDAAFDLLTVYQGCLRGVPVDPGESDDPELGDCCDDVDPGESDDPVLGDCCDEVDPGESEDPVLGDCCDEVDPGDSEAPVLGDCCDEVPPGAGGDDGGGYGGYDDGGYGGYDDGGYGGYDDGGYDDGGYGGYDGGGYGGYEGGGGGGGGSGDCGLYALKALMCI